MPPVDAPSDIGVLMPADAGIVHPCQLPGSVQYTSTGTVTVPGGDAGWPSLAFLKLPTGFCAHYFGAVGNARQMRFAPGGDLFVTSPTTLTTGGGSGGANAIFILPDANLDGVADGNVAYLAAGPSTQGLLFANGYLYYQDGMSSTVINRVPYAIGDRKPSGAAQQVADITVYTSSLHWPKTLDMADDGTLYVGNGGDQAETCVSPHPFHGGILKIDPAPGPNPNGVQVAQGLRNPINVRCRRGNNTCFALELSRDYSASEGGREKLIPIRQGDDWGFPCCATTNVPYTSSPVGTDCSTVATDTDSFLIGDTPFGIDFEPGNWPGQWAGQAFVALHGAAGTWVGARMVAIPIDGATGLPVPSSDTTGSDMGMVDFATGWDDGTLLHGRPAAVTFSPDGRLFVANDHDGSIFWIASLSQ
jgi:glucose/arabinose dehydrogenase